MDYYSSYFTQINKTIGANARFVKQFAANQEAGLNTTNTPSANNTSLNAQSQSLDSIQPMLMMLLFQLMEQMMGNLGSLGTGNTSQTTVPYIPGVSGTPTAGNTEGGAGKPLNNPAVAALENRLAQKAIASPAATDISFDESDVSAIRADLKAGVYTEAALGQALKYELAETPEKNVSAIGRVITDLTDSGDINVVPFLQNDYLAQLPDSRKVVLLQSIKTSGLRMDNGNANRRLIGFTLDALAKPGEPNTKALLHRFLQDFYDAHGQRPDTPVGKILSQTLDLAGITAGENGQLVF